jgi:hypothetical protein
MMKRIVCILACVTACCAVAQNEASSNQVKQIREQLRPIGATLHPVPGSDYEWLQRWAGQTSVQMGMVNAEIGAVALEASENTGKQSNEEKKSYWWMMCARMLSVMTESGDETFLPVLEQIGMTSPDPSLRSQAVKIYTRFKGIDAFTLVKKAVATIPVDDVTEMMRPNDNERGKIYSALVEYLSETKQKIPEEQLEPVYAFLIEKVAIEANLPGTGRAMDQFLCEQIPEYKTSRQRHNSIANFTHSANPEIQNMFLPLKTELDKIPEARRTDMRQRFKQLPALKTVEEAK